MVDPKSTQGNPSEDFWPTLYTTLRNVLPWIFGAHGLVLGTCSMYARLWVVPEYKLTPWAIKNVPLCLWLLTLAFFVRYLCFLYSWKQQWILYNIKWLDDVITASHYTSRNATSLSYFLQNKNADLWVQILIKKQKLTGNLISQ